MQHKMFDVMRGKMTGIHAINCLRHGSVEGQPKPPWLKMKILKSVIKKRKITDADLDKLAGFLEFELDWWRSRGWLDTRSFRELAKRPVPIGFDPSARLLLKEGV